MIRRKSRKLAILTAAVLAAPTQAKKALRVFQTLPAEPTQMDQEELMRSIRATKGMVFGGSSGKPLLLMCIIMTWCAVFANLILSAHQLPNT
jgi:hypothetical protein